MPSDATNMPYQRSAAFRNDDSKGNMTSANDKLDTSLKLENILLEEFNYASVTAYQAMEDRARVSNLYYVLLGALASGVAAIYQFSGSTFRLSEPLLLILLLIAGLISPTFFMQIIRLRQAHRESLICMNVIKEFYISQFQEPMPQIKHAFRWRLTTIPKGERFGSVTFVMSHLIALVGSLCFGFAAFLLAEPGIIRNHRSILPLPFIIAVLVCAVALLLHILFYRHALSKSSEAAIIEKQEQVLGILPPAASEADTTPSTSEDGNISLSANPQ